jgi:fructose transport system permease protein
MSQSAVVDPAEQFLDRRTPVQRVHHVLHNRPWLGPLVVLIIAVAVFGLINPRFLSANNLSLITQQVAIVGALAVGQTIIILTAGIDLSVGAAMLFCSLVMGKTAVDNGVPPVAALLLGFLTGALTGLLNGLLITRLNLPPFIATLGTLFIFNALTLLYAGGQTVRGDDMPALLTWTGETFKVGGFTVTYGVVLMLLLYVVVGFALSKTAWGRHVYAVGDDAEAARLVGIKVRAVLLSVYVTAGLVFAMSAWILIGRINAATPNAVPEANLDSITAVVIGGTSLFGGRGTVIGSLIGALIVGVFRNGLSIAGVDVLYQTLVVGILIIAAVAVDQWIRKVRS